MELSRENLGVGGFYRKNVLALGQQHHENRDSIAGFSVNFPEIIQNSIFTEQVLGTALDQCYDKLHVISAKLLPSRHLPA